MDELRVFIENFLNDEVSDEETTNFAIDLEEMLVVEESRMESENAEANAVLQAELPDICTSWEPGNDIDEFKANIRDVCARAILEYY